MDIHREKADQYQGLFNLMSNEHGLILTIDEMDEIIIEAQKVVNKNFVLADVSSRREQLRNMVFCENKIEYNCDCVSKCGDYPLDR